MATITRWDPWADLALLQREVNNLFARNDTTARAAVPGIAMDAFRTDDSVVLLMDLPGIAPDSVDVAVEDGMLTITGERKAPVGISDDAWIRRERPSGHFERSVTLPQGTDPDAIKASYDHGVLQVVLPHPEERRPRRIAIAEGDANTVEVGAGDS